MSLFRFLFLIHAMGIIIFCSTLATFQNTDCSLEVALPAIWHTLEMAKCWVVHAKTMAGIVCQIGQAFGGGTPAY